MTTLQIEHDVPLAPLTTMGVGGPARFYVRAHDDDTARRALGWARERGVPFLVLGGGSNMLVADAGFAGLVLHLQGGDLTVEARGDEVRISAPAGYAWDGLVAQAASQGWAGIEALSGIPGNVGATPIQNVGAYGQEVRETIDEVRAYDTREDEVCALSGEACGFAYRDSMFKSAWPNRYVILGVAFRLRDRGAPTIRYAELARELERRGHGEPTLMQVRQAVIDVRRRKSMVVDPSDPSSRSCGSFFTNPIISEAHLAKVAETALRTGVVQTADEIPGWPVAGGRKLSAAWLIERAGFPKGYARGRAGLSANHTLAVINRGHASARDILELVKEIQDGVNGRFGVTLVPEPVFVGFDAAPA